MFNRFMARQLIIFSREGVVAQESHGSWQDLASEHISRVMFTVSGSDVFSVLDPVLVLDCDLSGSTSALSTDPDETGHV